MIRILFALILIILMSGNAFCAATATQVDFLLAGLERSGSPLSGGKVFTYEAGTTIAKECWTDRDKTSSATNPIILSSEGRFTAFCDGVYKMVVTTSADVSILTMDGVSYGPQGAQWTSLSSYGSLSEAIADIGVTDTVLLIDTTDTLNANVTVPTNVTLMCTTPDAITLNSKILTVNGGIWAPAIECFIGTGTFTGSPIVQFYDPTWTASTVTDSTTPSYVNLTLSEPTLLTPVIADFSNATHNHSSDATGSLLASSIRDLSRNLAIINTTEEIVNVTTDEAILQDSSAAILRVSNVNTSADITNSGAFGLDTGGEAADTWHYVWLIGNSTAHASLISNSASSPTLPSGYTYKGLFGAVYSDSSFNFETFSQVDNMVQSATITAYDQTDFSTACISNDISANVPEIAKALTGTLYGLPTVTNAGQLGIYGNQDCLGGAFLHFENATRDSAPFRIPIEEQTIYLKAFQTGGSFTDANVFFNGWEY